MRDPEIEGSDDWNLKDNLWENYAHDSCTGNTEATNASARHRELLEKRRGSDEQRVGERFGKVMRVELVGCKQEGEHNLEKEGQKGRGTGGEQGPRTHSGARTLGLITRN